VLSKGGYGVDGVDTVVCHPSSRETAQAKLLL